MIRRTSVIHFREPAAARFLHGMIATALVLCVAVARSHGQEDAQATWAKLETAKETVEYKEKVKGGALDTKSKEFLEQIALPQLALEANRGTITTVRKRLREHLLNDIADEKLGDEANRIFVAFMTALAAKEDEPPVVRINAMLLISELQTAGSGARKPWPGAVATLAKTAGNPELPKELRVAAAAGLARHVDAAKANPELLGRISKDAGPQLVSIAKECAGAGGGGGAANDWLLSRSLSMLALLGPAGEEAVAEVIKSLQAPQLSFDTRVRAATALAAMAGPKSNLDNPAALIAMIEELAIASLQHDADTAERLKLEKLFGGDGGLLLGMSGGGAPGMSGPMSGGYVPPEAMGPQGPGPGFGAPGFGAPGFGSPSDMSGSPSGMGGPGFPAQPPAEHLIPTEVCRRAAWRLSSLANAILTTDEKRGLRTLIQDEEAAARARSLAFNLRSAANTLDTAPVDASLFQALADLKPELPPAAADDSPTTDDTDKPGEPSADPAAEPAKKPVAAATP